MPYLLTTKAKGIQFLFLQVSDSSWHTMGFPRASLIFPNPHRLPLTAVWVVHWCIGLEDLPWKESPSYFRNRWCEEPNISKYHILFRVKRLPERDTQRLTIHTVCLSCSLNALTLDVTESIHRMYDWKELNKTSRPVACKSTAGMYLDRYSE